MYNVMQVGCMTAIGTPTTGWVVIELNTGKIIGPPVLHGQAESRMRHLIAAQGK